MSSMKIYLILFGLMIVWGFNVSIVKLIVENMMPITITSFRIFTASLTVFLVLGCMRQVRLPRKNEWIYILMGTVSSVVFHHYFLATGLTKTSATNAGLILGMGPLLTVILSMFFLKKRPTTVTLLGFFLGGLGVSITVLFGSGSLKAINLGDVDIFLAILSQAFSFILINKASRTMDPRLLTGYMLLFGSISLFIISLWVEPTGLAALRETTPSLWIAFFFSAVLATGVGHMTYNYSIGQVGAAEASIFLNLNTFFSIVGAAILLNETIVPAHYMGLVLIISGVFLGSGTLEALILQRKQKHIQLKG
ncbi:DMT family transporter [Bacillus sp. V3B]|uniref:DMT family transporter n=1 Tax=Bacillus sp. V3B TaxID=2804915 RepID=UPI00210AD065|nr:DMT family transporter [Bacillus sp. V3B]MCQ6277547.1 DMT family transporter [Bacillus sp. V3B]